LGPKRVFLLACWDIYPVCFYIVLHTKAGCYLFFMLPYAMGGLAIPNLQSLMSGTMPENEQGMLQGGLTALMSLTTIVSPLLMTQSFTWATSNAQIIYFPGIAFSIGAVFIFTALLISVKYLKSYTVSTITESK